MSNVVPATPAIQFANTVPQLPAEMMAGVSTMFEEVFNDLGSAGYRRLRPRKLDFLLVDGNNQEIIPNERMVAVLVGSAPCNHAVWYERAYAPGQEPAAPDLIWKMPTPNTFPDALPVQFRSKITRDGREVWGFQTLRRTVWILCRANADGTMTLEFDRPFVFDISSMSLYGKSLPEQNMYKWAGIRDVCSKYSGNGVTVLPTMFLTQILLDTTVTVTGPVMFRPLIDPNTRALQFLDTATIMRIHELAASKQIKDMADVREKLTYGDNHAAAPTTTATTATDLQQPAPVAQPSPVPQAAPAAPAPQQVPVAQPVQPAAPAAPASDPRLLLQNAQAMLDRTNAAAPAAPSAPVATEPAAPAAPVAAPAPQPTAGAATTTNTVNSLLAQLNGNG